MLNFVPRTIDFVFNASPMFICTTSTAGFFMRTRKNQCFTNDARIFFSAMDSVTSLTTKHSSLIVLNFGRPSINGSVANQTLGIGISFIFLSHSPSIPQTSLVVNNKEGEFSPFLESCYPVFSTARSSTLPRLPCIVFVTG